MIAAIKRKQSNEYYTKSHTIFMHHEIRRFDDSKSVTIFTQEKSVLFVVAVAVIVARQIIEKLIEQSRRLKSIPSGVRSPPFSRSLLASHLKNPQIKHETIDFLCYTEINSKRLLVFSSLLLASLFAAHSFSISILVCTF